MSWLRRMLQWRVSPDWIDVRFGQIVSFTGGIAILPVAWYALAKAEPRPAEAVIGILASLAVSLLMIVVGLLIPLAEQRPALTPQEKS